MTATPLKRFSVPLALCLALFAAPLPAAADAVVGKPAPDFSGTDSNGNMVKLGDYRGRTVVLEWTNHGCPYVGKHYGTGNMQALQRQAKEKGIVWLSVISSAPGRQGHVSPQKANELTVSRKAAPAAVILDPQGTIGRAYEATATPHMYVIDKDGVLQYKGAIDDKPTANHEDVKTATNYVRVALAAVAAGKAPDPRATRAYGCSVKYAN
jgi:peroxiredoxin